MVPIAVENRCNLMMYEFKGHSASHFLRKNDTTSIL